jgi:hypothetical protein
MPKPSSIVDIGGYTFSSDPVTLCPRACNIPARLAIAVPQIPIK